MENENKYQRLINDSKEYARMRYDLLRLEVLEKTSRVLALFLLIILGLFLVLAAFTYFALAVAAALQPALGAVAALCIVGGVFLLILIVLFLFRKQIVVNPIVAQLSEIMFHEQTESSHEEDESNS